MIALLERLLGRAEASIVEARAPDAAALTAVHADAFQHGWSEAEFERLLADPMVIGHVARTAGGAGPIAGFVLSRMVGDEAEILLVAVGRSERGRGLARRLTQRHLGRLASLGTKRVFLEVDEGNEPALKLYARAGFREVGRRAGYYRRDDHNASALILRRDLA